MNKTDPSTPDYVRPEAADVHDDLVLVSDLLAGTRQMHKKAGTYIRKWKDERADVYRIRSRSEQVFEGLSRTLAASVGMLFAKEPMVEWNQAEALLQPQWDNIDASGTKGHVFVKRFAEASIRDGYGVLLVDHTPVPTDAAGRPVQVTAGNEEALGLRPTWAAYPRSAVLSWLTETIRNQTVVSQVVLHEPTTIQDGAYGVKSVDRYRVLQLIGGVATWSLYQRVENGGKGPAFPRIRGGIFRNRSGAPADFLPVAVAYAGRTDAPFTATLPLLGVAWANLGHWQLATNLRFYRELHSFPQPTVIGEIAREPGVGGAPAQAGKLKVGPMVAVHLSGENADYKFTSPSSDGYEPLKDGIKEKEEWIARLGMSFLVRETRAAETAEAKRLDATAENASLATAAQGIDDAVNLALQYHAWYLGIDQASAPVFQINRDFDSAAMSPDVMAAYVRAVKDAGLPPRLLLEAWQSGGRIPPDVDVDELLLEMMTNQAAQERQRQEELQAQLDAAQQQDPGAAA